MDCETLTKCMCHNGLRGYSGHVTRSNIDVVWQESVPQPLIATTLGTLGAILRNIPQI